MTRSTLTAVAVAASVSASAYADTYQVDKQHTEAASQVRHLSSSSVPTRSVRSGACLCTTRSGGWYQLMMFYPSLCGGVVVIEISR